MRKLIVVFISLFLSINQSNAGSNLLLLGTGSNIVAGFQGIGNIKSGAYAYYGLRAYNVAYATGSNNAFDVCDNAAGTTCSTIKILSTGYADIATAQASSACATACSIKTLYDQSGNARDVTQSNFLLRPDLIFTGCPSSKLSNGCIRFTAASHHGLTITAQTQTQPFTFIGVAERYAATTAQNAILSFGSGSPVLMFASTANNITIYAGTSLVTQSTTDNALHAVIGVFNGASSETWADPPTARTTGNAGAAAASSVILHVGDDGNGDFPSTYNYEWAVYGSALTNTEESNITTNQRSSTSGWNF